MANSLKDKFVCEEEKIRLDQFLNKAKPEFTRSYFKNLIQEGLISVNGKLQKKSGFVLKSGDQVEVEYPKLKEVNKSEIENLDVELVFEHPDFLIINKGPGVLVHPAFAKSYGGQVAPAAQSDKVTLVDWLLKK